jgi:hypothetical protein
MSRFRPSSDDSARTRLRAPIAAAVLTALLGGALAGCGLRGERAGVEVPNPPTTEMEEVAPPHASEPAASVSAPPEALLEQGRAMVVAGRFAEAVPILEAYLVFGDHPEHRVQAAWTLAMVYLLPESPMRSQSRALPLLAQIVESHPGTVEALQAGWLRGLLQEQARQRTTMQEQEQSLRELNDLVEQLKRIDLNRRPPGGGGGGGG